MASSCQDAYNAENLDNEKAEAESSCRNESNGKTCQVAGKRRSYLPFNTETYHLERRDIKCPNPFAMPRLQIVNPNCPPLSTRDRPFLCSGIDLMKLDHLGNPFVIVGQAFSGKTSLFKKLFTKAADYYGPKHWVRLVEFRDLVKVLDSLQKRPKCFMDLLATQMKLSLHQLRELFKPLPNARELIKKRKYSRLIKGELFLDGFDDIPASERDYFLKLLPQVKSHRAECPIRIWISCRTYFKGRLIASTGDNAAFEMQGYQKHQQIDILFHRWKSAMEESNAARDKKLKEFANLLYAQLQVEFVDFENKIGIVPVFMEIIAEIFVTHAEHYSENSHSQSQFDPSSGMNFGQLLDRFVSSVIELYCLKQEKPIDETNFQKEYQRIVRMYCRYAIETFPQYECDPKAFAPTVTTAAAPVVPSTASLLAKTGTCSPKYTKGKVSGIKNNSKVNNKGSSTSSSTSVPEKQCVRGVLETYYRPTCISVPEELYRVGFVIKHQSGMVIFQHHAFGDFFIGKYFALPDSLAVRDETFDAFFLRVLLFDTEAKAARGYFDTFLNLTKNSQTPILHDFLVNHYRLSKAKRKEWLRIAAHGNVWHLLVAEGYHRTAQVIVDAFSAVNEAEEMRQFFRMRAPVDIYEGKGDSMANMHLDPECRQQHFVSSMSVLALFGFDFIVKDTLNLFLTLFDLEEIRRMFNAQNTWTPVHYAAMHSNFWFIMHVFGTEFHTRVGIRPGRYNSDGQLPLHLLMTYSWYHVLILKDLINAEYDELPEKGSVKPKPKANASAATTAATCTHAPIPRGRAKGRNAAKGKRQSAPTQPVRERTPPPVMATCCLHKVSTDENHMHYRELVVYRDMNKDLKGEVNILRLVHNACIEVLVNNAGEDVNGADKENDMTCLHYAAQSGAAETVRLLIKLKANLEPTNVTGKTPLHFAALYGHRYSFMTLVNNGAGAMVLDHDGVSPTMLWKRWGEAIDEGNPDTPPMSVAEKSFFRTCYDLDKMAFRSRRQKEMEDELVENIEKLKISGKPGVAKDKGHDDEEGAAGEQRTGWREVKPDVGSDDEEEEDEEEEEVYADTEDEVGNEHYECDQLEMDGVVPHTPPGEPHEEYGIENGAMKTSEVEDEEDSDQENAVAPTKCISRRLRVKVVKKSCDPTNLEGFEELVIEQARRDDGGGMTSGQYKVKIQGRAGSPKLMELEFVSDDGSPLHPDAHIYEEVVSHLSKLLDFQRTCN